MRTLVWSGLVHSITGAAANVADITETERPLHGEESDVFADAGYTGVAKRDELKDQNVTWHVAEKRGKLKKMTEGPRKDLVTQFERAKNSDSDKGGASLPRGQ